MCYLVLRNLDYSVNTRRVSVCENAKMKMCNGNNGSSPMMSSNKISETVNVKNNKQVVMISACRMCIKIVHKIFRLRSSAGDIESVLKLCLMRSAVIGSIIFTSCQPCPGLSWVKHVLGGTL